MRAPEYTKEACDKLAWETVDTYDLDGLRKLAHQMIFDLLDNGGVENFEREWEWLHSV